MLIAGGSGSGKSDLSLRLIDRGARLVSDDYTQVRRVDGRLLASAPQRIRGKLEVRGIGVIEIAAEDEVPVCLYVDLERPARRLAEPLEHLLIAGVELPVLGLSGLEPSAAIKAELALGRYGLPL